jgi:hypothetical protein
MSDPFVTAGDWLAGSLLFFSGLELAFHSIGQCSCFCRLKANAGLVKKEEDLLLPYALFKQATEVFLC